MPLSRDFGGMIPAPLPASLSTEEKAQESSLHLKLVGLAMLISCLVGAFLDASSHFPVIQIIPLCLAVLLAGLSWRRYRRNVWLGVFLVGLIALLIGIEQWIFALVSIPLPSNGGPLFIAIAAS